MPVAKATAPAATVLVIVFTEIMPLRQVIACAKVHGVYPIEAILRPGTSDHARRIDLHLCPKAPVRYGVWLFLGNDRQLNKQRQEKRANQSFNSPDFTLAIISV